MSIEIITMWYNEAFLAPFFLNHYSFADRIRVIYDMDTTDGTEDIVTQYQNAVLEKFKFPDAFDNDIAVDKLNQCYRESKADWVIAVDADEFVLTPNLHEFLQDRTEDVFLVRLYEVYRNVSDVDLDPSLPIANQRRHGDPNAVGGSNKSGAKPIVVHTGRKIKWMPGQHRIWNRHRLITGEEVLLGAHWLFADNSRPFIERRLKRRLRQSKNNILRGHSCHYNEITENAVIRQLEQHMNDQRVF